MFDLDVSDETAAVVALCHSLAADLLGPAAKAGEQTASLPDAVRLALFETGLTVPVGEAFGGGGRPSCLTQFAAVEALAYGDPGLTLAAVWSGLGASLIGTVGTEAQKERLLPRFATDPNARSVVALYEGHGRSPSESTTTITSNRSGSWVVRGTKLAVANAATADRMIVVGVDPVDRILRAAMVKPDAAGVTVGVPERHIALDAAQLSTVSFDTTVDADALLGGPEADPTALLLAVSQARLLVAAAELGTSQRAVDYASKYASERVAFGKPISAFQGVSFMLADASIRIAAAKVDALAVASQIDSGDVDDLERQTTNCVNFCGVVATQATRDGIQVLGGHGFITDHPVELWYRSAAALAAIDFDPLCSAFEPAL